MKDFLQKEIKIKKGDITTSDGQIVGQHDGLAFYTVGQRIGICHKPFYVVDKNIRKNQLIVGHENDLLLYKKEAVVKDINWIAGRQPKFPLKCKVRLRHRQPLQNCVVKPIIHNLRSIIHFINPQRAITPGQFAVFYKGQECLGGGVVK